MKILLLLSVLAVALVAVRPPAPLCRSIPLPPQIPVTIGEEVRFDLEDIFSGYNLYMNSSKQSHIKVSEKYTSIESKYPASYNLTTIKIKPWGRFLGLVINGAYTQLVAGQSNDAQGMTFDLDIQVESKDNLHCYDVDEILTKDGQMAIVDCAHYVNGEILYNELIFVNMTTKEVSEGSHLHDTFVHFNFLKKRSIQVMYEPFSKIPYLVRLHMRDGVSDQQQGKTYMEIFMLTEPKRPQLLDVIDHTFFDMDTLSIADYQIYGDLIYILIYNKGLYELRLTPDQNIQIRSRLDMQLDITRFRVDHLGFNDDINLVMSNQNTVYQFEWDVTTPPVLVTKYALIPKSTVKQLFVDNSFVIVTTDSIIDDQITRRTWIFTKKTTSYLNAYNAFHAPMDGPHIIVWNEHGSTLHLFHDSSVMYFNLSLPYVQIINIDALMVNKTETFEVTAESIGDNGEKKTCSEKFQFLYLAADDKRILQTGYWPRNRVYVDSPETTSIPLSFQFFGANLTYDATFETNSSTPPYSYVDKQHQAIFKFPTEIDPANIVYYEMFVEQIREEEKPTAVYGVIQTGDAGIDKTIYKTFYIRCGINVFDRDQTHHLTCTTVTTASFSMGRILSASQVYDPEERRIAFIFDSQPSTVYVYFFWTDGFGFYGRKDYAGVIGDKVTGVSISDGKLFVVLQLAKRIDIFALEDIHETADVPVNAKPRMVIDHRILRFFGVTYFAPVSVKVSHFHKEAIFVKTKVGLFTFNVNEQFIPELLFRIDTKNINYDFEVNHDHLLMMTSQYTSLYDLQAPLRRQNPPFRRNTFEQAFHLGEYDEVCSDRLFYIVGNVSTLVLNPGYRSVSILFSHVWADKQIISVDAVNIKNKEIFFMRTKTEILAYIFTEEPSLTLEWSPKSPDFNLSLAAHNPSSKSESYKLEFEVIDTNETEIKPTEYFDADEVAKLGHLQSPENIDTYEGVVQINDTHWFEGTVLDYQFNCSTQECQRTTTIQNHVELTRTVVEGRAIYDIQSSDFGIFAQQYASIFKTYTHNDSIHFINMIPTTRLGEVCTKMATGDNQEYIVSLCQLGFQVNLYITTLVGEKPFTFGPYQTDAKSVNYAKIVGQILMIVDNEDNPFVRSGGILIYHLNFDFDAEEFVTLLDYIDHDDLQIQGYTGTPFIGSADLHMPFWNVDHEYRLFLTETRTGSIFVFGFEISDDGEELVYLSKKYIPLDDIIPHQIKYPTPLKVQNIAIHYAYDDGKEVEYYLLLTVQNWHHMEIMLTLDHQDEILGHKVERLFERFPWTLRNYFKYKRGRSYSTFFAVPYVDSEQSQQLVMVYQVPFIVRKDAKTYAEKYSPHSYTLYDEFLPLLGAFGGHPVTDIFETAYDFHTFGGDKMLWSDMSGTNISEISLNPNVTLTIKDRKTPTDTISVTALNPFTNFTFTIDVDFTKENEKEEKEILGIVIIGIGAIMILGLLIVFCRQGSEQSPKNQLKDTLITQEDKAEKENINRTSVDPESIRGSIDPTISQPVQRLVREKSNEGSEEERQALPEAEAAEASRPVANE